MRSPLKRRYFSEGKFKNFNLLSYDHSLITYNNLVALLCTNSITADCLFNFGDHILFAYSKWGLTILLYINLIKRNSSLSKYENDLLMIPKILLAFDMQFWMCASKDNFPSNITPKSFSSEQIFNTDSSSPDFKMYLYLGLLYPICKTWHLFTLKCRPHLKDHSWSLAKSSCKVIEFLVMLKILVSSANIRQKLFVVYLQMILTEENFFAVVG